MKETIWKMTGIESKGRIKRLEKPKGKVDVVIDTDTYNEIDDQFALAYLIQSEEKLNLKAIYAAPFYNHHSNSPADGMEKSYQEILKILTFMEREDLKKKVYRGATSYLSAETEAVSSNAALDLAARAMEYTEENPLYVIAIGAITNVASAILLQPEIKERMVVIWLGGNALHWPDNKEFNLQQDIAAARVIFDCEVPLVLLPCMGVVSAFATSGPELEHHLRGRNKLCDYLLDVTEKEAKLVGSAAAWTRSIWDVTAVAWLLDGDFMEESLIHSPILKQDGNYICDDSRHYIKYVYHIKRDQLFSDLFEKLKK